MDSTWEKIAKIAGDDEDLHQELCLCCLLDPSFISFQQRIDAVVKQLASAEEIYKRLKEVVSLEQTEYYADMFDGAEKDLVGLLLLGYDVNQISVIMGIDIVMVHRGIEVVRHRIEVSDGSEETIQ